MSMECGRKRTLLTGSARFGGESLVGLWSVVRFSGSLCRSSLLLLFYAIMVVMLFSALPAYAQKTCVTAECHSSLGDTANVHPAELLCDSCHVATGASHPGSGKGAFTSVPGICLECHDNLAQKKSTHAPVREGNCMTCHNPHAGIPKLLGKAREDMCRDCHQDLVEEGMTVKHEPFAENDCLACHQPHQSDFAKLLGKGYSDVNLIDYTEDAYALCFSCHDADLLQFPDTSFATGFRDGDRNLHYLHVNRPLRGKSCRLCHAAHSSSMPKLMLTTTMYGKWKMPVGFEKSASGGSCTPGCHKPVTYDRDKRVGKE